MLLVWKKKVGCDGRLLSRASSWDVLAGVFPDSLTVWARGKLNQAKSRFKTPPLDVNSSARVSLCSCSTPGPFKKLHRDGSATLAGEEQTQA